jgi:hypothetical protein
VVPSGCRIERFINDVFDRPTLAERLKAAALGGMNPRG